MVQRDFRIKGKVYKPFINKFKASQSTAKAGETIYLTYDFINADEAYIIEEASGKVLHTLPVPFGVYSQGRVAVTLPQGISGKHVKYDLRLKNRDGTAQGSEEISILP